MSWNIEHGVKSIDCMNDTPGLVSSLSAKRDRLEKTLWQTQSEYRSIFENALVGMFQATKNGYYLLANTRLASIFGYESPVELMAKISNIKEQLYVEPNRHPELISLLKKNQSVWNFESQVYRQNGEIIWISENLRPLYDPKGRLLGYEGTVEDITQRKHSEEIMLAKLKNQQEMIDDRYRFLSMVCHELRTFLTIIITSSDLLKNHSQRLALKEREKYFDKIKTTVKTMNEVLEGFLVIGKTEASPKQAPVSPFDLQNFCEGVWQDVQTITQTQHQLIFNSKCPNITLVSNQNLLRQMLINLLLNAVKYSPKSDTVYLELDWEENQIIFRIKDEGVGIPKAEQKHLFDPFHRASNVLHFSGTGLGMVIVKRAVELQNGKISFESEIGVGTTFTVRLPTICTKVDTKNCENKIFCICDQVGLLAANI